MGPRRALASAQEGAQAPRSAPPLEAREPLTGERFPRRVRLARGADLAACWDEGRRLHSMHTAVARNRVRRRLREILRRELLGKLPAVDLVVRAKRSAYAASFADLRAELTACVSRVT